jgi:transcriptional regulator with XRE-family HTH domain
MAQSHTLNNHPEAERLRKEAGAYLRKLREAQDITQAGLAKALGIEYYTMISQIERGVSRVPPDRMQQWAEALGVEPRTFAQRLLQFYDPYMWQLLFGKLAK